MTCTPRDLLLASLASSAATLAVVLHLTRKTLYKRPRRPQNGSYRLGFLDR